MAQEERNTTVRQAPRDAEIALERPFVLAARAKGDSIRAPWFYDPVRGGPMLERVSLAAAAEVLTEDELVELAAECRVFWRRDLLADALEWESFNSRFLAAGETRPRRSERLAGGDFDPLDLIRPLSNGSPGTTARAWARDRFLTIATRESGARRVAATVAWISLVIPERPREGDLSRLFAALLETREAFEQLDEGAAWLELRAILTRPLFDTDDDARRVHNRCRELVPTLLERAKAHLALVRESSPGNTEPAAAVPKLEDLLVEGEPDYQLNQTEAAAVVEISPQTLDRRAKGGAPARTKDGAEWRYPLLALLAWKKASTGGAWSVNWKNLPARVVEDLERRRGERLAIAAGDEPAREELDAPGEGLRLPADEVRRARAGGAVRRVVG